MAAETLERFVVALELLLQNSSGAAALFPVDDGFQQQFFNGNFPTGEGVILPTDADEGLLPQAAAVEALLVEVALHNGEVQLVVLQQLQQMLRVVHDEGQGVVFYRQVAVDLFRQNVITDGFGSADLQLPDAAVGELLPDGFLLGAHGPGVLLQGQSGLRLAETAILIAEKAAAVLLFQKVNVLGDRRLGDMEPLGSFPVIHDFTKGQKGLDAMV